MLSIKLSALAEYRWTREVDKLPPKTFPHGLLYHQWRTYQAEEPLIVNTSPTGTGKTKAALLRLLKRAQQQPKLSANGDALLIAPTNELLRQHVEDARQFCEENELPYAVHPLSRETLDGFIADYQARYPGLPHERRGADLVTFLRNSNEITGDFSKQVALWVVNPDIFHYAVTYSYHKHDRGPVFDAFFERFNYLIIDELHYYDAKQLATFLFFMKLSQHRGYLRDARKHRQFCILTATPRPYVRQYLERLGEPIAWIEAGVVAPEDQEFVEPTPVLAPTHLHLFTTEELQEQEQSGALLQLVTRERETIRRWLDQPVDGEPMEGAIISSSLGMINRIHQQLCACIDQEKVGRITGAELSEGRAAAKEKPLILATPTVDIGYNFEHARPKRRQNIDFLFFDASFGDEVLQRLGRAGRVLGKEQQEQESIVYAVVDPVCHELLQQYDGAELARTGFNKIIEGLPGKNDLSIYLRTGAIAELYRPIVLLQQGMSDAGQREFLEFLVELQGLLCPDKSVPADMGKLQRRIRGIVYGYEDRRKYYQRLDSIPAEAFEKLRSALKNKRTLGQAKEQYPEFQTALEVFWQSIKERYRQRAGQTLNDIIEWLSSDLRQYAIERARLSFRESFQPPLALVYDPDELHSSKEVATYNALHFVRNYHLIIYPSLSDWCKQHPGLTQVNSPTDDVAAYFRLLKLREEPLHLALTLDARPWRQEEWEETFAYRVTALHGLRIIPSKDHTGLPHEVQALFAEQFIPAFVARQDKGCQTYPKLYDLQKRARFYPLSLRVTFSGSGEQDYLVVLGNMAFHVYAELPRWAMVRDLGKTLREDDLPIIC
jgi:CRISPR-associated endonuclease/helicase Cas3